MAIFYSLFSCKSHINKNPQRYNLNIESLDEKGKPLFWKNGLNEHLALGYPYSVDSVVKHDGKYALKLQFIAKTPSEGIVQLVIPSNFTGTKIKLSGYVKTENVSEGHAGLYMKLNGENGLMGRDLMGNRGLTGNNDWKKLSISLPFSKEVELITIGMILQGKGTCWLDDLSINIDGDDISEATPKTTLSNDSIFSKSSNFDPSKGVIQTDAIAALGQIWGFMKYYHPEVRKGRYNWDAELFKILPLVTFEPVKEIWMNHIETWVNSFKYVSSKTGKQNVDTSSLQMKPYYGDLFTPGYLSPGLFKTLQDLKNSGLLNDESYYVDTSQIGVPNMIHEKLYANMPFPDAGYRLLALFRYHAFVQYFFPYRNQIEEQWSSVLKRYIPIFLRVKNENEYDVACAQLITNIHDTHAQLYNENKGLHNYLGAYFPPFKTLFVEGKLIVGDFINTLIQKETGLDKGDIILSINNHSTEECVERLRPITSGSNEAGVLRNIAKNIVRGDSEFVRLKILHDGKSVEKIIKRYYSYEAYLTSISPMLLNNTGIIEKNSSSIYYINASQLNEQAVKTLVRGKDKFKGVIIDFRNNISFDHLENLVNTLKTGKSSFAIYSTCNISLPGSFKYYSTDTYRKWGSEPSSGYNGKIILLVNENTQSSGEFFAMAFQENKNTQTIGSMTAGADGNLTIINLPGFVTTGFSGIGVFYPDKTVTQRAGIKIDQLISPSIKGIKENRDEVMEMAIKLIIEK